jgi:hypothetical protein
MHAEAAMGEAAERVCRDEAVAPRGLRVAKRTLEDALACFGQRLVIR